MGKATIISAIGEGKYTVALDNGREVYLPEAERLLGKIVAINLEAAELDVALAAAEALLDTYQVDLDAAIAFLQGSPDDPALKKQVETNTSYVVKQRTKVAGLRSELNTLKLRRLSLQKRRDVILNLYADAPEQADLWCADYTESLQDDVETIEIGLVSGKQPGKIDNPISIIAPAGQDGDQAAWSPVTGTRLVPKELITPNQSFLNYALTPGAAKWKPRYRVGTIQNIDGDTCIVEIDETRSTHQSLDINQSPTVMAGFSYMNCNESAFLSGDRVVVAFEGRDWENAVVVGFENNPRPCVSDRLIVHAIKYNAISQSFDDYFINIYEKVTKSSTARLRSGRPDRRPTETDFVYDTQAGVDATGARFTGDNFKTTNDLSFGVAPINAWTGISSNTSANNSGYFKSSTVCANSTHVFNLDLLTCWQNRNVFFGYTEWLHKSTPPPDGEYYTRVFNGHNYWQWTNIPIGTIESRHVSPAEPPLPPDPSNIPFNVWDAYSKGLFYTYMMLYKVDKETGEVITEQKKSLSLSYEQLLDEPATEAPEPTVIAVSREIVCNDDIVAVVCGDGAFIGGIGGGWTYDQEMVLVYDTDLSSPVALKSRAWANTGYNPNVDRQESDWVEKYAVCASKGLLCVFDPVNDELSLYSTTGGAASYKFSIFPLLPVPEPPATAGSVISDDRYFWIDSDGPVISVFYGHRFFGDQASIVVVSSYQFILTDIETSKYSDLGLIATHEYNETLLGPIRECFMERSVDGA